VKTAVHAVAEDSSVVLSFLNISLTIGCMDLPNNAHIVLSSAHNLQVMTIKTIYVAWASCARGWNFYRFADFGSWAPPRPTWRAI